MNQRHKSSRHEGFSRRSFLTRAGVAAGSAASASVWLSGVSRASAVTGGRTGVLLNLRGGNDALCTVCPVTEAAYHAARPNLAVAAPAQPSDRAWLDAAFAMNPAGVDHTSGVDMVRPYLDGNLVFVHGAGWTDQVRSHFKAMQIMEYGSPAGVTAFPAEGWAARYLDATPPVTADVRAFSHTTLMPTILRGAPKTSAITDVSDLAFPGPDGGLTGTIPTAPSRRYTISESYAGTNRPLPRNAAVQALVTLDTLSSVSYPSDPTTLGYPDTELGEALANAAAVIKDPTVHVELIHVEMLEWDHHADQGPHAPGGKFHDMLGELSKAVGAFYLDVGAANVDRYLMMIYTEFGRQIAENGDLGTDHGYGGLFTAMGAGVHPTSGGAGGTVWHEFAGDLCTSFDPLNGDAQDITVDYRDLFAEGLVNRLGLPIGQMSTVFPNFNFRATPPGVIG